LEDLKKKKGKSFSQKRLSLKQRKELTSERKVATLASKGKGKAEDKVVEETEE